MERLRFISPALSDAERIAAYRAEFSAFRPRVTPDPRRVSGLDGLEDFDSVSDWLLWCGSLRGKADWYMTVRERDSALVGMLCLRRKLEYDDDDPDFCSNIGYSIRPSERGKGYGQEQLRLGLLKARELGLESVRIVCRDSNIASKKVILANGGVYRDTVHGEESHMNVERYDVSLRVWP